MSFYGVELSSRLLLGTARYPSPAILSEAIKASGAEVVTVSLRRESGTDQQRPPRRGSLGLCPPGRRLGDHIIIDFHTGCT